MQKTQLQKEQELIRLSITPAMAESFITVAEKAIADYREELHKVLEPFKELENRFREIEKPYLEAKSKIEALEMDIQKHEMTLELISRARTGDKKQDFRIKRATSHKEAKIKTKREGLIKWNKEFGVILREENRFMKFEELAEAFFRRYPNLKTVEGIDRKLYQQHGNMKEGEKDVKRRKEAGKKNFRKDSAELLRYKDEWGLAEWMDENYVPLPKYMKQFMYSNAS